MNFIPELQQLLLNEWLYSSLKTISELSSSFNQIILFIISIIALLGAYFWYMDKNYYSRYFFKSPSDLEFLYHLVAKGIGGVTNSLDLLKYANYLLVFLILVGGIAYFISGIKYAILIFFLGVITWLKIIISLQEILKEEAIENNNYISLVVVLTSLNKFLISLNESIFSRKLLYVIIYLLISIILFLVQIEYFYLWAIILILIYAVKFCNVSYELKLLQKRPLFAAVEYSTGDTEQSLMLYETTATDYRFKHKISGDELIIPITSIKKIYYDYDSELDDVERVLNYKVIKKNTFGDNIINMPINNIIISLRPILFYTKAVIYSKKKDFEKAENCLSEAIKLDNKFREIAENDKNLENIRNENWFINLIDDQGKNL